MSGGSLLASRANVRGGGIPDENPPTHEVVIARSKALIKQSKLFQFIEGANLNFSRIPMTVPVLTSVVPGAGPLRSSAYDVKFYLPVKFQGTPPLPLPELDLKPDSWKSRCTAVRKFSGFARDNNIVKEAEKLAVSLSRSAWANSSFIQSEYAYSIGQYNSPFRFIGRVNEVWVDVDGSEDGGCKPHLVAEF